MNSGSSTVTIEARDTSGNVATKSYSVNVTGGGSSYTWDANGNLATKTEGGDSHVYTWDAENRLTKVETNSVEIASFKYDPRGRRVEKMDGGVTTAFTYNGEDILRQAIGSTFTKYVHGPRIDEPLASEDGSGVLTLLSADDLGSIVSSTNAAGAIVSTVRYDAWGNIESGVPGTFGFTGREPDQTGLGYYRARYYDPKVGRFVSEDPSGFEDGTNLYVYTRDNPVLRTDPTGLASATWYEISMCIKDDLAACQAKRRCANRAEAATTNEYGRDTDGARSNAFKHCFGACCMSRSVGPCRAETTAMWHEWNTSRGPGPTNPRKDWSMDLYNNYQGAARAGLFPAQGCRRICLDAPASYYRPEAPPPAQRPKGSP
jgi:RHS repeat-associated protein